MSKTRSRSFPAAALAAITVLAAAATTAHAGDTERERVPGRDLTRRQADSLVDPNGESSGRLRRELGDGIDAPLEVEAAIAWAPGGPDAGGGSGDPWEPDAGGPRYDLEELPAGPGDGTRNVEEISDDGLWVSGEAGVEGTCWLRGASLWERTDAAGWVHHSLPGVEGGNAGGGSAEAVLDGGLAVGTDHPCPEPGGPPEASVLPVFWEPIGPAAWSATQLPAPGSGAGYAFGLADIPGLGVTIVGQSLEDGAALNGALWTRVAGSWIHVPLGRLASGWETRPFDISSSGVIVGKAFTPDHGDGVPFVLTPTDSDADGVPDTWFEDADGDGNNDLIRVPTNPPASGGAQAVTVGDNVIGGLDDLNGSVVWTPIDPGDWLQDDLPSDGFPEGTTAVDLNGHWQATGWGHQTDNRGDSDDQGLLWEQAGGEWTVSNLNDITEKGRFDIIRKGRAIAANGVILAKGDSQQSSGTAFVLTPR